MALAETMESGGGGDHPVPRHNTCRMELPRPFHPWPSIIHHQHHLLHPLQALHLPCQLPLLHPEGMEEPQTHQPSSPSSTSPPPSPPCSRREERDGNGDTHSVYSGEQTDSEREDLHQVPSRRGPLPDLLPENEHPSWGLPQHRAPGAEEAELVLEVRRVASQLRAIGDDLNETVLRRAQAALQWQDWGGVWRGLLTFISDTLSTLYRLT